MKKFAIPALAAALALGACGDNEADDTMTDDTAATDTMTDTLPPVDDTPAPDDTATPMPDDTATPTPTETTY